MAENTWPLSGLQGRDIQLLCKSQHVFICLKFLKTKSEYTTKDGESWQKGF
jgi:hypothetical protein